ncbi:MAG: hypothetical protein WBG54_10645 [Acidobacteriaceae bacterium]
MSLQRVKPFLIRSVSVAALAMTLYLCGCDSVLLENPLPAITNDHLVGSWATPDGKLAFVIRRGEGQSYEVLTSDELTQGKPGSFVYLARAGNQLVLENHADCDGHLYSAPAKDESPDGCWGAEPIVSFSADSLVLSSYDADKLVQRSQIGMLKNIELRIGMSMLDAGDHIDRSQDVLIMGNADQIATFLAGFSTVIMTDPDKDIHLHRI